MLLLHNLTWFTPSEGDADVAYLAGARYRKTEKSEMMGVTTVFSAAGVDKQKFLQHNGNTHCNWGITSKGQQKYVAHV